MQQHGARERAVREQHPHKVVGGVARAAHPRRPAPVEDGDPLHLQRQKSVDVAVEPLIPRIDPIEAEDALPFLARLQCGAAAETLLKILLPPYRLALRRDRAAALRQDGQHLHKLSLPVLLQGKAVFRRIDERKPRNTVPLSRPAEGKGNGKIVVPCSAAERVGMQKIPRARVVLQKILRTARAAAHQHGGIAAVCRIPARIHPAAEKGERVRFVMMDAGAHIPLGLIPPARRHGGDDGTRLNERLYGKRRAAAVFHLDRTDGVPAPRGDEDVRLDLQRLICVAIDCLFGQVLDLRCGGAFRARHGEIAVCLAAAEEKGHPLAELFPVFTAQKHHSARRRSLNENDAVLVEPHEDIAVEQDILIGIFEVPIGYGIAAQPFFAEKTALHHKNPCVTAGRYRVI